MRVREHGVAAFAIAAHLAVALPAFAASDSAPVTGDAVLSWQVLTEPLARLEVHGAPIDGGARTSASMLYPTGGLGILGLAMGVMVHAGLEGAKQSGERTAAQEAADRVTEPYRPQVAEWSQKDLWGEALTIGVQGVRSIDKGTVDPARGLLEMRPTLVITQDQRALLLENQILVRRAGRHQDAPWPLKVTVVSAPQGADKTRESWLADRGALLKGQLAVLLRESLKVVLHQLAAPVADVAAVRQRTVRYMQGGEERVERAQVVVQGCGRYLLQTLRGDFLSVPQGEPDVGDCAGQ